jgi:rubrerythrin
MKKMTEDNVKAAFAGESQAHVKYAAFAEKAKQEQKPNIARLFTAASFAEQVHAGAHLRVLKGVGSTVDNLDAAIGGENFEVEEMYPAFIAVADAQAEPAAKTSFARAMEAEVVHHALYAKSKDAAASGEDADLGDLWVCSGCGWTGEGPAPDKCPLCGAPASILVRF